MDDQDHQTLARLEQLLEDTRDLAEENNRILLSMQRTARWAFWGKLILWAVIILLPILFIGPILDAILPFAFSGDNPSQSVFGLPSPEQLEDLISAYQGSTTAP